MKDIEREHREKWRDLEEKANTLLEEIRACREYKEIKEEVNNRIEEIFNEYTELLKEGMRILSVEEKIKTGVRIFKVWFNYRAFRARWLLLKLGRLMMGMDI